MAKIRGKFAPLTDELGNDERFIIESTDLDKLLYVLIIYTCHMTYHSAPKDPQFYKKRYGLRSKLGQIAASLGRLQVMYPKISWGDKNLSLLNSPTYKNELGARSRIRIEEEIEQEIEQEIESDRLSEWKKIEAAYPNKASITKAMQMFFASQNLKSEVVLKAIEKYKAHLAANTWKKPMNLDRFLTEIDAWLNHIEPVKEETGAERDARILAKFK